MAKKPLRMRLVELRHAILLLKDARRQVRDGERQYLQVLSGQLRALVGAGGRGHVPLLINLADTFGIGLPCFGAVGPEIDDKGQATRWFRVLISITQVDSEQKQIDLREWLDGERSPFLYIDAHRYNPAKLIKLMSDKFGGAHYDATLSVGDLWPLMVKDASGVSLPEQLLVELAGVVCDLGDYVIGIIEIGGLAAASELSKLGYRFDPARATWIAPPRA